MADHDQAGSGGTVPLDAEHRTAAAKIGAGFLGLSACCFGLLVVGATVRVHGAGLSCPDWPLCFGELIPRFDFRILLEWGHRLFAGSLSLGFLALSALVLRSAPLRARFGGWIVLAAAVLAVQIVLGGLTVLKLLAYWSVTSHLLTGNLFLFLLCSIGLGLRDLARGRAAAATPAAVGWSAAALGAATFLQMGLGGLVASQHAGTACPTWPSCNGLWFPTLSGIVGLQIVHRLGAYTVLLLALIHLGISMRAGGRDGQARRAVWIVALILAQITLGVINVFWGLPVETAILHAGTGDLLLLATLLNARACWPARSAAVAGAPARGVA